MAIKLLLDGDWITYTAGFAGQKHLYIAPQLSGLDEHDNMTSIKEEMKLQEVEESGPVYSRTIVDPLDHVLHSAKKMIETQVEKTEDRYGKPVILRIFLDGDGNFRNRIATIRPYKGNRIASKPVLFAELRQYLYDTWDAELVYDQEADDAMAIEQTNNTMNGEVSVICAVDKDMLQVPGYHLNPNKGFKTVGELGGLMRLYVQAATGDATDNIGGVYKVGPVKAKKYFMEHQSENEGVLWDALVELYAESIDKYGVDIYMGLDAKEAALENMRLVYLRRKPNEIWLPPHER